MKYKKQQLGEIEIFSPREESKLFKFTITLIALAVLILIAEHAGLTDAFIALWK